MTKEKPDLRPKNLLLPKAGFLCEAQAGLELPILCPHLPNAEVTDISLNTQFIS